MTLPYAGWLNAGLSLDTVRSKRSNCYLLMKKICAFQSSVPSNSSTSEIQLWSVLSSKLYDQNKSWSCRKVFAYSYFFWATWRGGRVCIGFGKFKRLTPVPAPTSLLLLKHDVVLGGNIGWHNRSSADVDSLLHTPPTSVASLFISDPHRLHADASSRQGACYESEERCFSWQPFDIINSSPQCRQQT